MVDSRAGYVLWSTMIQVEQAARPAGPQGRGVTRGVKSAVRQRNPRAAMPLAALRPAGGRCLASRDLCAPRGAAVVAPAGGDRARVGGHPRDVHDWGPHTLGACALCAYGHSKGAPVPARLPPAAGAFENTLCLPMPRRVWAIARAGGGSCKRGPSWVPAARAHAGPDEPLLTLSPAVTQAQAAARWQGNSIPPTCRCRGPPSHTARAGTACCHRRHAPALSSRD